MNGLEHKYNNKLRVLLKAIGADVNRVIGVKIG